MEYNDHKINRIIIIIYYNIGTLKRTCSITHSIIIIIAVPLSGFDVKWL